MKLNIETLTDKLLSLSKSGVYITNHDIIDIGKKLGINIDYKKRELVIKKLFALAKEKNLEERLENEIKALIKMRVKEYEAYANDFMSLKPKMTKLIKKALHVKDLL